MSFPKNLIFSFVVLVIAGCGVKGDPLPPEKPAEIGRGRPTYRRAVEDIRVEKSRPGKRSRDSKRDKEDEDEEQE